MSVPTSTSLPGPEPVTAVSTSASIEDTPMAEGTGPAVTAETKPEESSKPAVAASNGGDEQTAEKKVADQIEFYLSDHNLPFDKFLFETTQGTLSSEVQLTAPGTGWIALTTLLSFKRMKPFQDLGLAKVAQAIKDHSSDLLEVNPEGTKVKRTRAIQSASPGEVLSRSVYVKGFPAEADVEDLQEKLESWFRKFGRVHQVRMRREGGNTDSDAKNREFKGSVFTEFATVEIAKAFLAMDPKPTFPYKSTDAVEAMSKKDFVEMKAKEKGIDLNDKKNNTEVQRKQGSFNAFHAIKLAKRGGNDKNDRQRRDRGPSKAEDIPESELVIQYEGKDVKITKDGTLAESDKLEYRKGAVLGFSGIGSERFQHMEIKKPLFDIQSPTFVRVEDGASSGLVGFKEPVSDAKLQEIRALNLKISGSDSPLEWRKLEGDEENEYHTTRAAHFASAHIDNKLGRGRESRDSRDSRDGRSGGRGGKESRGRGRGGRGGGRGGGRDRDNNRDRDDRRSPRKNESVKATTEIAIAPFDEMPAKKEETSAPAKREREDGEESAAKKAKTDA